MDFDDQSLRLARASSTEDVHRVAMAYNWDVGVDGIFDVISHPMCSLVTALEIYWLAEPWWWKRQEEDGNADALELELIQTIEENVVAGVYQDDRRTFAGSVDERLRGEIPEAMFPKTG